jgi:hypothetical protein
MGSRVKVKLKGGPKDGEWVDYSTPLPPTLVIPERSSHSTKFHNYDHHSEYEYHYREPK